MNDFDYDCMTKKKIAYGARHKKCGSKSRMCFLPSDRLTVAQLKKKNGEETTLNLRERLTWQDFKKLSVELQKDYITYYVDKYDCKMVNLGEIFGVQAPAIRRHLLSIGYNMSSFKAGKHMGNENRKGFLEWLNQDHQEKANVSERQIQDTTAEEANACIENAQKKQGIMDITYFDMEFSGTLNISQISNTILAVAKDKNVRLRIIVKGDTHE